MQQGHEKCSFHLGPDAKTAKTATAAEAASQFSVLTFEKFVAHLLPAYLDGWASRRQKLATNYGTTCTHTDAPLEWHICTCGAARNEMYLTDTDGRHLLPSLFLTGASAAADLIALLISLLAVIRCQRWAKRFSASPQRHGKILTQSNVMDGNR